MASRAAQGNAGSGGSRHPVADKAAGTGKDDIFEGEVREAARQFTKVMLGERPDATVVSDLLAAVWGLADGAVAAGQMVLPYQRPLACREGCSYCCYLQATVSAPEVLAIAAHVTSNWSEEEFAALRARVAATDSITHGFDGYGRLFARVPCPLLRDGKCSVYEVRPFVCRGYNSHHWAACAHEVRHPTYWRSVPHDALRRGAYTAALDGICAGLSDLDYRGEPLELIAALKIALDEPDAFERWAGHEDVFAEAAEDRNRGDDMKASIDGIFYDTGRAEVIASFEYGMQSDPTYRRETLYLSSDNSYFMMGVGGPDSYYAKLFQGKYVAGQDLLPLRADEARRWLEDQRHTEAIERLFPQPDSAAPDLTVVGVRLSGERRQRAERAAARAGVCVEHWIERLVARELTEVEDNEFHQCAAPADQGRG